jgi:hypothetical protein
MMIKKATSAWLFRIKTSFRWEFPGGVFAADQL